MPLALRLASAAGRNPKARDEGSVLAGDANKCYLGKTKMVILRVSLGGASYYEVTKKYQKR